MEYNPHDQNRPLGIVDHKSDGYIPFTVQQYFDGVKIRAPTIEEYNDCPNRVIPDPDGIFISILTC